MMLKDENLTTPPSPVPEHTIADQPTERLGRVAAPSGQPALAVGHVVNKCLLTEVLGRGGWCTVFRAWHQTLNVAVAVKVVDLAPDDPGFAHAQLELRSEAHLLARLNHPHMVRLFEFDDSAVPSLVLECVDGPSLRDRIVQRGRLQPDQARQIIRQAAEGLSALWALGGVHRDVKSGNILLGRDGIAKIADLGTARILSSDANSADRPVEEVAGTVAYLAPEQFLAPAAVDWRADMYGLGATYYEALTGRLPFAGRSRMAVLLQHANQAPIPPHELIPEIDPAMADIVLTMLAKDPDDRFADTHSLLGALHESAPASAPPLAPPARRAAGSRAGPSLWHLLQGWMQGIRPVKERQRDAWLASMKRTLLHSGAGSNHAGEATDQRQ